MLTVLTHIKVFWVMITHVITDHGKSVLFTFSMSEVSKTKTYYHGKSVLSVE